MSNNIKHNLVDLLPPHLKDVVRELSRMGINIDAIERGQVTAEEQASNAFVQQIKDYNSSE